MNLKLEDAKAELILSLICEYYNIDRKTIKSKSKKGELDVYRKLFYALARKHTELKNRQIGFILMRSDSSIVTALKIIEGWIATDVNLKNQYLELNEIIKKQIK